MRFADPAHRQTLAHALKKVLSFCCTHALPEVRPNDPRGYPVNPNRCQLDCQGTSQGLHGSAHAGDNLSVQKLDCRKQSPQLRQLMPPLRQLLERAQVIAGRVEAYPPEDIASDSYRPVVHRVEGIKRKAGIYRRGSGGSPLVPVMESTDFRKFDYGTKLRRMDGT